MKKRNVVIGQKVVDKLTGEKRTIRGVGYTDDYVLVREHPSVLLRKNLKLADKDNLICGDCSLLGAAWGICPSAEDVGGVDVCLCTVCYNDRVMDI